METKKYTLHVPEIDSQSNDHGNDHKIVILMDDNYDGLNIRQSMFLKVVFESWITPKSSFQTTYMQSKLLPRLKAKYIYLRTRLLQPSLDEYLYINLPKGLQWGYYFIKPYRLIKKNVFKN